ncbi:pirin family protein [Alicyclobacillus sp. SO9]|uniref:pirin family protein n=1 Tax=Alicyclobacillus sp. SO9 TaxID=2665646 RepID=UPI0018E76F80|nr:pirin-like C-terminal cupin domain-containing protein [Alicyclobacillus sp. SO9]QQE80064.1 pirin family protein [Alicyclobacillus sp. SO9]
MSDNKILKIQNMDFPWTTEDPFLMTVHHQDAYPRGNEVQGPATSLDGRNLGQDYTLQDGFRMYHGSKVPGFPAHPHKGFETVTIVLKGFVDHFDSTGSCGRYGNGDVQWLTTGRGAQHTEMFPLVHQDKENPLELFQIWLNLPSEGKSATPEYKMLWAEDIPETEITGSNGETATVRLIAGSLNGRDSLEPTKASWASVSQHHVGIFLVTLSPGANLSLPPVTGTLNRNLYFYQGDTISVEGTPVEVNCRVKLAGDQHISITNGATEAQLLVLEGEPIREPVAQYGPFVMNTQEELRAAFEDYQRTQFGGWQWDGPEPVNERTSGRFAQYADGTVERREG